MEAIIRNLSSDGDDLLVLYEEGRKNWSLLQYACGVIELEKRIKDYFGINISLPINDYEISDNYMIIDILRQGAQIEKAGPLEAQRFFDSFVEDIFLKRYPNIPSDQEVSLEDYVDFMANSSVSYIPEDIKERLNAFLSIIHEDPSLIGLPQDGTFYREVRFLNRLSKRFSNYKKFKTYCELNIEPDIPIFNALAQVDLVYLTKEVPYIIELKQKRVTGPGKWYGKKQNILAFYFLRKNFGIDSDAVLVEHQGVKSIKIRYRHRIFNPESKKLEIVKQKNWEKISL